MALTERFALMLEPDMIEKIDNYRHANRIGTRAETVRKLISRSLAGNKEKATTGSEFGDLTPSKPENSSNQEKADAERT